MMNRYNRIGTDYCDATVSRCAVQFPLFTSPKPFILSRFIKIILIDNIAASY